MAKQPEPPQFSFNDLGGEPSGLGSEARRNLQCNILRSTDRLRSVQVFHRFSTPAAFRSWLNGAPMQEQRGSEYVPPLAVSNSIDATDAEVPLVNVLFTYVGLSMLGVRADILEGMDGAFKRGARDLRTLTKLLDTPPMKWGDHRNPWHAVELRAFDDHEAATAFATAALEANTSEHEIKVELGAAFGQDGNELHDHESLRVGHFGIADPKRDPVYTQEDYAKLLGGSREPAWKWDPRHKLSSLLVPDPLTSKSESFGTYFVYRKYKQDVRAFIVRIGEIAATISARITIRRNNVDFRLHPIERHFEVFDGVGQADLDLTARLIAEQLDAQDPPALLKAVLETKAGNAIVASIFGVDPQKTWQQAEATNFNYDDDDQTGRKCPFAAHARKMNPRGLTGDVPLERRVTVARRSLGYREKGETGLLFWCAQASIGEQFEYIQQKWANGVDMNPDHNPTPGVDLLIGRMNEERSARWERWMDSSEVDSAVWRAVTLEGSEYFFAPSLSGIAALRNSDSEVYKVSST